MSRLRFSSLLIHMLHFFSLFIIQFCLDTESLCVIINNSDLESTPSDLSITVNPLFSHQMERRSLFERAYSQHGMIPSVKRRRALFTFISWTITLHLSTVQTHTRTWTHSVERRGSSARSRRNTGTHDRQPSALHLSAIYQPRTWTFSIVTDQRLSNNTHTDTQCHTVLCVCANM